MNIIRRVLQFLREHLRVLIVIVIAIVAVILAIKAVKNFLDDGSGSIHGIVKINGSEIGVYDTKEKAKANPISPVETGIYQISGKGSRKIEIKSTRFFTIQKNGKNGFTIDLNGINNVTTVFEVLVGGDGSLTSNTFEAKRYYFAIKPQNDSSTVNNQPTDIPGGILHFGNDVFQTYSSEGEAQQAEAFTISSNLVLTAEPSANTARIWVKICRVDTVDWDAGEIRLNQDNGWTNTMNFSEYKGHLVTLAIKFENKMATQNTYQYVSLRVKPE